MFNDKRIFLINGQLKRNSLIMIFLFSFMFLIGKVIYMNSINNFKINYCIVEIVLMITSIGCIVGSFILSIGKIKDDSYFQDKVAYYNKAFKIIIFIATISYGIYVPYGIYDQSSVFGSNFLILFLIYFILLYFFVSLRAKNEYFNYAIIEDENIEYYRKVLKNIGYLGIILFIAFGVSIIISLVIKLPAIDFLAIFLIYCISYIALSFEYLFFSYLEKSNYIQAHKKLITDAILISIIIALLLKVIIAIINYFIAAKLDSVWFLEIYLSVAEHIAKYMIIINFCQIASIILLIIGTTFIYHNIKEDALSPKSLKMAYIMHITIFIISGMFIFLNEFYSIVLFSSLNLRLIQVFNDVRSSLDILFYALQAITLAITCIKNQYYPKRIFIMIFIHVIIFIAIDVVDIIEVFNLYSLGINTVQSFKNIALSITRLIIIISILFSLQKKRKKTFNENKINENNVGL